MRDYAKVSPMFWTSSTGRSIVARGPDCTVAALYLITCPHANMLGIFNLPTLYVSHETGLSADLVEGEFEFLESIDFCTRDPSSDWIFVHNMAAYQIGATLAPTDNRRKGVLAELKKLVRTPFVSRFLDRYAEAFSIDSSDSEALKKACLAEPLARSFEGASKGLRRDLDPPSKQLTGAGAEEEQEQEQEKKNKPGSLTLPDWVDSEAWRDWKEMRRRNRSAPTLKAEQLALAKLTELTTDPRTATAIINRSIERGWKSFFPLEDYANGRRAGSSPAPRRRNAAEQAWDDYEANYLTPGGGGADGPEAGLA